MTTTKRACLIYVAATANMRPAARARLENEGYTVCEVLANLDVALAAQAGTENLPPALTECITHSEICVFLLPEDTAGDRLLGACGILAGQLGKSFIGVVEGVRENLPQVFDDNAAAIVRDCGDGLTGAIRGDRSFVKPDGSKAPDRKIDHIRCQ